MGAHLSRHDLVECGFGDALSASQLRRAWVLASTREAAHHKTTAPASDTVLPACVTCRRSTTTVLSEELLARMAHVGPDDIFHRMPVWDRVCEGCGTDTFADTLPHEVALWLLQEIAHFATKHRHSAAEAEAALLASRGAGQPGRECFPAFCAAMVRLAGPIHDVPDDWRVQSRIDRDKLIHAMETQLTNLEHFKSMSDAERKAQAAHVNAMGRVVSAQEEARQARNADDRAKAAVEREARLKRIDEQFEEYKLRYPDPPPKPAPHVATSKFGYYAANNGDYNNYNY
jgi:hypothetical protein